MLSNRRALRAPLVLLLVVLLGACADGGANDTLVFVIDLVDVQ